jgi:phosphoribosylformimino-5-aminoimidazole carboxamide ribotide isomerase
MKIIPAIDLIDGACVRLHQGDYDKQTTYNKNPLQVVQHFESVGFKNLHLVDLDGAKAGIVKQLPLIKNVIANSHMQIDVGGGITTMAKAKKLLEAGAAQINIGSLAVKQPTIFIDMLQTFGPEKIILSADVQDELVKINGWQSDGNISIFACIENYLPHNLKYICVTDISKDGTLTGPSIELYKKIQSKYPTLNLIASGGVGSIEDVYALKNLNLYGAIIGKAIYENKIDLNQLVNLNHA